MRSSGRSCEKSVERVLAVASPSFQYRVSAHKPTCTHHIENPHSKPMATPFACFGRSHAPENSQELNRKNTIVGKYRGKAATSLNLGLAQWRHYLALTNFSVSSRRARVDNVLGSRHCCQALAR